MKNRGLRILVALLWGWMSGCRQGGPVNTLTQITYASTAGTILPELQWHEEITITQDRVALSRNGSALDSEVNAGTWALSAEAARIAALFAQLEAVDCTKIARIEPEDPLDGGSTESYTLTYADSTTCRLTYDPGVTYTSGDLIVDPVQAFIKGLQLPEEAANRYK